MEMTQEQFSSATGVHLSAIRKYENRLSVPSSESLLAISQTGVNIHWLLTGDGEMVAATSKADQTPWGTDADLVRRITPIARMLGDMEDAQRSAILKEFFSRVQDAKRLAELESQLHQSAPRKIAG